ncbi:hypothetical protein HK405_007163 [Cladochytrium tenue]|nr:hypothetical protein HK405_007163 [Cladochytrium tenue]
MSAIHWYWSNILESGGVGLSVVGSISPGGRSRGRPAGADAGAGGGQAPAAVAWRRGCKRVRARTQRRGMAIGGDPAVFLELFGGRADPIWLPNRLRAPVPPQLELYCEDESIVPVENSVGYSRPIWETITFPHMPPATPYDAGVAEDDDGASAPSHTLGLSSKRFADFDISWCVFKRVPLGDGSGRTHGLKVYVMVPKSATAAAAAAAAAAADNAADAPPPPPVTLKVAAKFHGGGWTHGAALFPDWFPVWLMEFAVAEGAAIVTPNYRMLPESRGADFMEDMQDFWRWLAADDGSGLRAHVAAAHRGIDVDLGKVIAFGESAGGHLALHSGIVVGRHTGGDGGAGFSGLRAVIATNPGGVNPNGVIPRLAGGDAGAAAGAAQDEPAPAQILAEHLRLRPDGAVVSEMFPPARRGVWMAMIRQRPLFHNLFGGLDDDIWLLNRLRALVAAAEGPGAVVVDMPPQILLHGEDDDLVSVESSMMYARLARKLWGPDTVDLVIRPGGHGFDADITMDAMWLREKLEKISAYWNL